ncbi:MAG TPA: hypothetical protein VNF74_06435 [Terriglobales bacterium]|nr:hypothetical protein [Terriglobales bacterium]
MSASTMSMVRQRASAWRAPSNTSSSMPSTSILMRSNRDQGIESRLTQGISTVAAAE